jgi:hypothetical protein
MRTARALQLRLLPHAFTIHRFSPDADIPAGLLSLSPSFIARTEDELSIVCPSGIPLAGEQAEPGWACFKVCGTLDFGEIGILARLSSVLAHEQISLFAVSTYNTDYFLVRTVEAERAKGALVAAGYTF